MRRVYTVYTVFNFGARKIGFAESKNVYVFSGEEGGRGAGGGREGVCNWALIYWAAIGHKRRPNPRLKRVNSAPSSSAVRQPEEIES